MNLASREFLLQTKSQVDQYRIESHIQTAVQQLGYNVTVETGIRAWGYADHWRACLKISKPARSRKIRWDTIIDKAYEVVERYGVKRARLVCLFDIE